MVTTTVENSIQKGQRYGILGRLCFAKGVVLILSHNDNEEDPISVKDALSSLTKKKWQNTLQEKMNFMKVNKIQELVDPLKAQKAIGNEWNLKYK